MEPIWLLSILLFTIAELLIILFSIWLFGVVMGGMILLGRNIFTAKTKTRTVLAIAYFFLTISAGLAASSYTGFKLTKKLIELVFGC